MVRQDGKTMNPVEAAIRYTDKNREIVFDKASVSTMVSGLLRLLEYSIELQSHYASLLNMQDGGQRIIFKDATEWAKRMEETTVE